MLEEIDSIGFERNGHVGFLIFESLPTMTHADQIHIATKIAYIFPENKYIENHQPFKQHLHTSFMRKVFGMTSRNGTLLSITHPKRKHEYNLNCDMSTQWQKSFEFMKTLETEFVKLDKQLGIILVHETQGHRYGDLYVLTKEQQYHDLMIMHYKQSYHSAKSIKCTKQMYVLWYWIGCYYYKSGNMNLSKRYLLKFLSAYEKYKKYARVSPSEKLKITQKILNQIGRV